LHHFIRPEQLYLRATREPVDAACGECGGTHAAAYRVLSEGGWWNVVKCQDCLASISREPDAAYGSFVPLGLAIMK
jgi:vanillate/4-hydroxybenzoate decarboxylase subunit D